MSFFVDGNVALLPRVSVLTVLLAVDAEHSIGRYCRADKGLDREPSLCHWQQRYV